MLRIKNNKVAVDNREKISAKYYYDNFINYDSFVQNNFQRQRKNYEGIEIPFSYSDYKEVLQNSYFTTNNGERGRITSLVWSLGADTAQIDFYIEEIYTRNLKEEFQETN